MSGMKLSEAIRLGAMMGPQCFGPYAIIEREVVASWMGEPVIVNDTCTTCAIGAALLAAGRLDLLERATPDVEPGTEFPVLMNRVDMDEIPEEANYGYSFSPLTVYAIIVRLNDHLYWSRERIADWVATLEPVEVTDERPAVTALYDTLVAA